MRGLSAVAAGSLALGVGCRGDDWIVAGELPRDVDLASGARGTPELLSDPEACPSSLELFDEREQQLGAGRIATAHVGRWRGTLGAAPEDVASGGFPSLELALDVEPSGAGRLLFDGAPSERSQFAGEGYLCSAQAARVVCGSESGFVAGFAYPIVGAQSRDRVLTFAIAMADPWGEWCTAREPVPWEDPGQGCGMAFGVLPEAVPHWSALGCSRAPADGGEPVPIDCGLMYALEYCQCARDACFARLDRTLEVGFLLSEDGTVLSGSLWYEDQTDASPLELRRVP